MTSDEAATAPHESAEHAARYFTRPGDERSSVRDANVRAMHSRDVLPIPDIPRRA